MWPIPTQGRSQEILASPWEQGKLRKRQETKMSISGHRLQVLSLDTFSFILDSDTRSQIAWRPYHTALKNRGHLQVQPAH